MANPLLGVSLPSEPPLLVSSASLPLNGQVGEVLVGIEQGWRALLMWARGDSNFVPPFVTTKVLFENDAEIRKSVQYFADVVDPPPAREQIVHLYPDYLAVTHYLEGICFFAFAGIDTSNPTDPKLFLTTIRRREDPAYRLPAEVARAKAGVPTPGTAEQNVQRILLVIRRLVADGKL